MPRDAGSPDEPVETVEPGAPSPGQRRRKPLILAGVLLLVGIAVGGAGVVALRPAPDPALHARIPAGDRVSTRVAAEVPKGFTLPTSTPLAAHVPPVEVAVPAIAVRSRLIGLHLNADGTLQVPQFYGIAGWYSDGPAPGDAGHPAVIVGHVDSKAGPGIFYRLPELKTGDAVLVRRADGADVRFVVYRAADFPKDAFPADQVYAAQPQPELRLITCTGTFDRASGHYTSNRVVYARLALTTAAAK